MPGNGARIQLTQVELLRLHQALQRNCACQLSHPAVLDEACAAHRMLRDDAMVARLARVGRSFARYVKAEFSSGPGHSRRS
jgi:hypothetical protein